MKKKEITNEDLAKLITGIDKKFSGLDTKVGGLDARVSGLVETVSDLNRAVDSLAIMTASRFDKNEGKISFMEMQLTGQTKELRNISATLSSVTRLAGSYDKEITALDTRVSRLEAKKSSR